MITIDVFACLTDNYGFLVRDEATGQVACIDTPDPAVIERRVTELGWGRIDYVFNTHKHWDHADGNAVVKALWGCTIIGPAEIAPKNPVDHIVMPGDKVSLGATTFDILDLSGHTLGLIGWHAALDGAVFIGDCLFPLGCGRMFEGTAEMFWASLERLCALPEETLIYSAHEYTLSNLAFAESLGRFPALDARARSVREAREANRPTVPSTLREEMTTNPFLVYPLKEPRSLRAARFGELRALKDVFR